MFHLSWRRVWDIVNICPMGIIKPRKIRWGRANVILDLDELLDVVMLTVRRYYPDARLTEIRVGRGKVRVYGRAGRIWFKVVAGPQGTRVYSNSRTIERVLRRRLEGA